MRMQRDLVGRARNGDTEAFSQLVRASAPRMHGVASLILHDPDRAKDAVQDALIAAWNGLPALKDPAAWDAWLRRLTVRSCYRLAKREQRRSLTERDVASLRFERAPDPMAGIPDREWVMSELGRLHIDQRAVITLHYYLDLPLRQVAEILDVPFGTAASRLHRGLQSMRSAMREPPAEASHMVTERMP